MQNRSPPSPQQVETVEFPSRGRQQTRGAEQQLTLTTSRTGSLQRRAYTAVAANLQPQLSGTKLDCFGQGNQQDVGISISDSPVPELLQTADSRCRTAAHLAQPVPFFPSQVQPRMLDTCTSSQATRASGQDSSRGNNKKQRRLSFEGLRNILPTETIDVDHES